MKITALEQQANNPERYNLYVDGRFMLGVGVMVVMQMGLKFEQEITSAQLDQLQTAELRQKAIDNALNYLSFRPRSRSEVQRHLQKKEFAPEVIESALEHLDRLNFVDDRAFSTFWKETRDHFSPRGASALKNELRLKGVDREIIDEMITPENDEAQALEAGRKKARTLLRQPEPDYQTFHNRLGSFLQRRGFSYSITAPVVQSLWRELTGTEVPDRSARQPTKKTPTSKQQSREETTQTLPEAEEAEAESEESEQGESVEDSARAAAYNKAQSLLRLPKIDYQTFYRRLSAFLQRRGFSYAVTNQITKALWDEGHGK